MAQSALSTKYGDRKTKTRERSPISGFILVKDIYSRSLKKNQSVETLILTFFCNIFEIFSIRSRFRFGFGGGRDAPHAVLIKASGGIRLDKKRAGRYLSWIKPLKKQEMLDG